jgi:hypothetical protein
MSEADHLAQERRLETRLYGFYPLRVRVKNSEGQSFTSHTVADNLCSGGLYFQFPQSLPADARLFVLIQLPEAIRIAARGRIVRHETQPYGLTGMAIRFSHARVLSLSER